MFCKLIHCLVFCFAISSASVLTGFQLFKNEGASRDGDFMITKSVGVGLTGVDSSTNIMLVDELGMQYDTFSILKNPAVRNEIGLNEDQYRQIFDLHAELVKEVDDMLGELVFDDQDEGKSRIETRFYEMENEIVALLDDNQLERLGQVKLQTGIARFGLENYLNMEHVQKELNIRPAKLAAINELAKTSDLNKQIEQVHVEANERLLAEISDSQREQFEELFEDKLFDDFLKRPLFSGKNRRQLSDRLTRTSLVQLLLNSKVADELELNEDQLSEIREQRRELYEVESFLDSVEQLLDADQLENFCQIATRKQVERWGSVRGLANGFMAELLGLEEADLERLMEQGKELHEQSTVELKQIKLERELELLAELSSKKPSEVDALIGEPFDFEIE